ncbi:uncharacterized protein LOC142552835 [Primulina tabacum]|uniref:uncharacterized protein LOC142552835 n=1 Tax=Primulina tabacum TaxID=48773 RepID=UPI003F592A63
MASGNSGGSIQSSSSGGGDEEYDSRSESISSFYNKNPPNFTSLTSSPHPPSLPQQNPASYYNNSHIIPSAQNLYLYPPSTPNFQYNNINISDGMIWPAGLRSEANSTDTLRNQSLQASSQANAARPSSLPEVTKNPKKRTRASRRAPTTVLTTDTTNFRQMVQEFTGIPTAPFPGSPYSRRMNLLSGASALRPTAHFDGLGPLYSLRPPIPQNIVPAFSSSSSSPSIFNATMIDAIVSTTNIVTTINKTNSAAVLGDISSNNPNNSPLLNSDQALLNLQHHHNSSLNPSLHGHRFEANGSIDFGNYLSDFRNQEITSAAAAGDLKINDGNITVWRSGESVKNDDGIQEKFMPFDGKI